MSVFNFVFQSGVVRNSVNFRLVLAAIQSLIGSKFECVVIHTFKEMVWYGVAKGKGVDNKKDSWIPYCRVLGYVPYQCRHRIIRFKW